MNLISFRKINKFKGFTFLELLIVVSIVAIIGASGVGFYLNYSKTVGLNSAANTIVSDLKQAQNKSMSGVQGLKWGIRFANSTSDYYEIFSTSTDYIGGTMITRNYLPSGIVFSTPADSNNLDVIFNKISGSTTGTSVIIGSNGNSKTISVSSVGSISVN